MKKLLFLLFGVSISAAICAQTGQTKTDQAKKTEMKDLRGDVRAHKEATHKVNHDLAHVRVGKAIHDHKTVHRINKDENTDAMRLREKGVSHPITKAKRQVQVQSDNRKDHTE